MTWNPGVSGTGVRRYRPTLLAFRRTRPSDPVLLPGRGIRIPMEFTKSTSRRWATRCISWKSEWARLKYHQSWAEKQIHPGSEGTIAGGGPRTMPGPRAAQSRRARRLVDRPRTARAASPTIDPAKNAAVESRPWRRRWSLTRLTVRSDHRYGLRESSPPT